MFIRDPSRPITGECMLKGFRFSNTLKWISQGLSDYGVDATQDFSIGILPIEIIFPSVVGDFWGQLTKFQPKNKPDKTTLTRASEQFDASILRRWINGINIKRQNV
jgi:hypothetical protein